MKSVLAVSSSLDQSVPPPCLLDAICDGKYDRHGTMKRQNLLGIITHAQSRYSLWWLRRLNIHTHAQQIILDRASTTTVVPSFGGATTWLQKSWLMEASNTVS